MGRVRNIGPTVTLPTITLPPAMRVSGSCHAHSKGHMGMFRAKCCRDPAPGMMYIPPIRWDANRSLIRIEILASKI
jgi:hypothetical protein